MTDLHELPADLPRPENDGACDHLTGMAMPSIALSSTFGGQVDLADLGSGRTVIYCYPRTGRPGEDLPSGWDAIPGARGCTPQACVFRDHADEIAKYGAHVFGLSTQGTAYQREMAERLHLPFAILSDEHLALANALLLPTFEAGGTRFIKRLTLIVRENLIEHVFYPVFPPTDAARHVVDWLEKN